MSSKLRFRDISPSEVKEMSDGCGIVARGLRVPNFIWEARCDQHDFYTMRGTGWDWNQTLQDYRNPWGYILLPYSIVRWWVQGMYYLQKANWEFYYWMLVDAFNPFHQILEKIFYTFLATVFWIAVSLWAFIAGPIKTLRGKDMSSMRSWRTKEEILAYSKRI